MPSSNHGTYLEQIRFHLHDAITSLEKPSSSSTTDEKSKYPIRPYVELSNYNNSNDFKVTQQMISRKNTDKEKCYLEVSKNSIRVSFVFKQQSSYDPIDQSILSKYMKFFQQRAEDYTILRRKPIEGYSVSFLILNTHVATFGIDNILEVVLDFLSQVDRECSDVKITINARARLVASEFMKEF